MSSPAAQSLPFPPFSELPLKELERIAQALNAAILLKKSAGHKQSEGQLLRQINATALKDEERSRYCLLAEKLEADTLTETEHPEFMALVSKDEKLRNKQLKLLIVLSQLRNVPLLQLMETLGLIPAPNG